MSLTPLSAEPREVEYPESDGKPMADNTLQFRWIVTIEGNIDNLFRDDENVFVAGDLLWYPVEGEPRISMAPDTMVVFGRPKGYRGSYLQWQEGGIAPQVVFEVLSPKNTHGEMQRKLQRYDRYGVEEYYQYDPDRIEFDGWLRRDAELTPIEAMQGWVSPRLGIRFELTADDLNIYRPDGQRFLTFIELCRQREEADQRIKEVEQLKEEERLARLQAQARADAAQQSAEQARRRAEELAAKLRAMGVDPDGV